MAPRAGGGGFSLVFAAMEGPMTAKILIAAAGLLVSTSAWAQADPTPDDLACQLSGKCVEAEAGPAEEAAPADQPASRIWATRGFKISRKPESPVTTQRQGVTPTKKAPGAAQPRAAYQAGKNKA